MAQLTGNFPGCLDFARYDRLSGRRPLVILSFRIAPHALVLVLRHFLPAITWFVYLREFAPATPKPLHARLHILRESLAQAKMAKAGDSRAEGEPIDLGQRSSV